ncbi:MAG: hypothetical protein LBV32_03910 [Tannerellaceae bacterium]|jgi:hypothetical protein|nr:hypothetical protein [Tannerellaceae bacterium]
MKNKQHNPEQNRENPFRVPEGYFENLTSQIMSGIPEQPAGKEPAKVISMADRVRPWLYLAAVFVGLLLFFKALVGITGSTDNSQNQEPLLVHTEVSADLYDEDEEYLEYLENQYANYILAEEMDFSE